MAENKEEFNAINDQNWSKHGSMNQKRIQMIQEKNPIFFNISDKVVDGDREDSNILTRFYTDWQGIEQWSGRQQQVRVVTC